MATKIQSMLVNITSVAVTYVGNPDSPSCQYIKVTKKTQMKVHISTKLEI